MAVKTVNLENPEELENVISQIDKFVKRSKRIPL